MGWSDFSEPEWILDREATFNILERGFKSTRVHGLTTPSKTIRFRSVYTKPFQPFFNCFFNFFRFMISPCEFCQVFICFVLASHPILRQNKLTVFKSMRFRCFRPFTRPMKPNLFENAPLLKAFSKQHRFNVGLYHCRVNERRNRIDAVT